VLEFNVVPNRNGKVHPTQKPIELLEWLINTYSNEEDLVLDNTMGSGSTGVACRNLNRNFIGIEKDEKYFDIAKQRIEEI
jgi:site-specific DNA-methyltransferase (adenine-specific)